MKGRIKIENRSRSFGEGAVDREMIGMIVESASEDGRGIGNLEGGGLISVKIRRS